MKNLTAVIIKGNPKFIDNCASARVFYHRIGNYLKSKGYRVTFDAGEPHTKPIEADLWIGHSRGADRLRFAPAATRTLAFGSNKLGAINSPGDDVDFPYHNSNLSPPPAHFEFTAEMRKAIDNITDSLNPKD